MVVFGQPTFGGLEKVGFSGSDHHFIKKQGLTTVFLGQNLDRKIISGRFHLKIQFKQPPRPNDACCLVAQIDDALGDFRAIWGNFFCQNFGGPGPVGRQKLPNRENKFPGWQLHFEKPGRVRKTADERALALENLRRHMKAEP